MKKTPIMILALTLVLACTAIAKTSSYPSHGKTAVYSCTYAKNKIRTQYDLAYKYSCNVTMIFGDKTKKVIASTTFYSSEIDGDITMKIGKPVWTSDGRYFISILQVTSGQQLRIYDTEEKNNMLIYDTGVADEYFCHVMKSGELTSPVILMSKSAIGFYVANYSHMRNVYEDRGEISYLDVTHYNFSFDGKMLSKKGLKGFINRSDGPD